MKGMGEFTADRNDRVTVGVTLIACKLKIGSHLLFPFKCIGFMAGYRSTSVEVSVVVQVGY